MNKQIATKLEAAEAYSLEHTLFSNAFHVAEVQVVDVIEKLLHQSHFANNDISVGIKDSRAIILQCP